MPLDSLLAPLRSKIVTYGKENQGELLYALAEGAQLLSGKSGYVSTWRILLGAPFHAHIPPGPWKRKSAKPPSRSSRPRRSFPESSSVSSRRISSWPVALKTRPTAMSPNASASDPVTSCRSSAWANPSACSASIRNRPVRCWTVRPRRN